MHGDNGSVAKSSQHGGARSQLSASRGDCSNRQNRVRGSRSSHARGGEARFRSGAVRQFYAAVAGGRAGRRGGENGKELTRRYPPDQCPRQSEGPGEMAPENTANTWRL